MSTDTQYTPGPWEVAPYSHGDEVVNVVKDYKRVPNGAQAHWIAELDAALDFDSDQEAQLEEMYANAHLIAAAPDLYQALKMLLADIEEHQRINHLGGEDNHAQVQARAAIAKAEGGPR